MIRSFRNDATADVFNDVHSRVTRRTCPITLWRIARRKLEQLNAALSLESLSRPPGNRLEALQGNRQGQYSIRINEQYRVCFRWTDDGAEDVEIVDYH